MPVFAKQRRVGLHGQASFRLLDPSFFAQRQRLDIVRDATILGMRSCLHEFGHVSLESHRKSAAHWSHPPGRDVLPLHGGLHLYPHVAGAE